MEEEEGAVGRRGHRTVEVVVSRATDRLGNDRQVELAASGVRFVRMLVQPEKHIAVVERRSLWKESLYIVGVRGVLGAVDCHEGNRHVSQRKTACREAW